LDANTPYQIIDFVSNKFANGDISPDEYNLIINAAQTEYMNYLLGDFQQFQPGKPAARIQYSMTEQTRQRITPFIAAPTTLTIDSTGAATYPGDYVQADAMYDASMNRIRYVPQNKLYSVLGSVIDPVATNPIYLIIANGFQFYPKTIPSAILSYIRKPKIIVWGVITDGNGRVVYNAGTSTPPEWADVDMMEIIARSLRMVGVNLSAPEVSQYANEIAKQGQ